MSAEIEERIAKIPLLDLVLFKGWAKLARRFVLYDLLYVMGLLKEPCQIGLVPSHSVFYGIISLHCLSLTSFLIFQSKVFSRIFKICFWRSSPKHILCDREYCMIFSITVIQVCCLPVFSCPYCWWQMD
jgi:hypothetical protein